MDQDLKNRLEAAALAATRGFCYSCYTRAESGRCNRCGSDDLMREMPGHGVEYGTEWVIKSILEDSDAEITDEDLEERLCETLDESYPPYRIGECEFSASQVLKELDPVSFRCALADEHSNLIDDGQAFEFGDKLYHADKVKDYLSDLEQGREVAS